MEGGEGGGGEQEQGEERWKPRVIGVKKPVITDSNTRVKNTTVTVSVQIRWWPILLLIHSLLYRCIFL